MSDNEIMTVRNVPVWSAEVEVTGTFWVRPHACDKSRNDPLISWNTTFCQIKFDFVGFFISPHQKPLVKSKVNPKAIVVCNLFQ